MGQRLGTADKTRVARADQEQLNSIRSAARAEIERLSAFQKRSRQQNLELGRQRLIMNATNRRQKILNRAKQQGITVAQSERITQLAKQQAFKEDKARERRGERVREAAGLTREEFATLEPASRRKLEQEFSKGRLRPTRSAKIEQFKRTARGSRDAGEAFQRLGAPRNPSDRVVTVEGEQSARFLGLPGPGTFRVTETVRTTTRDVTGSAPFRPGTGFDPVKEGAFLALNTTGFGGGTGGLEGATVQPLFSERTRIGSNILGTPGQSAAIDQAAPNPDLLAPVGETISTPFRFVAEKLEGIAPNSGVLRIPTQNIAGAFRILEGASRAAGRNPFIVPVTIGTGAVLGPVIAAAGTTTVGKIAVASANVGAVTAILPGYLSRPRTPGVLDRETRGEFLGRVLLPAVGFAAGAAATTLPAGGGVKRDFGQLTIEQSLKRSAKLEIAPRGSLSLKSPESLAQATIKLNLGRSANIQGPPSAPKGSVSGLSPKKLLKLTKANVKGQVSVLAPLKLISAPVTATRAVLGAPTATYRPQLFPLFNTQTSLNTDVLSKAATSPAQRGRQAIVPNLAQSVSIGQTNIQQNAQPVRVDPRSRQSQRRRQLITPFLGISAVAAITTPQVLRSVTQTVTRPRFPRFALPGGGGRFGGSFAREGFSILGFLPAQATKSVAVSIGGVTPNISKNAPFLSGFGFRG